VENAEICRELEVSVYHLKLKSTLLGVLEPTVIHAYGKKICGY